MGNLADLRWRGHGASQCQIQIRMHKYRKDMGNSVDPTGGGGMRMQKQIASDPEKNQSSPSPDKMSPSFNLLSGVLMKDMTLNFGTTR